MSWPLMSASSQCETRTRRQRTLRDVTAPRLEQRDVTADVGAGHDTRSTDERGADVADDAAVQVGHDL